MRAFRGEDGKYVASVAVDASTIGNVTIATAVYASRRDEVSILESSIEGARSTDIRFVPFKSKSHHFDKARNSDFFEYVISANEQRVRSLYFQHHSSSQNQHYVEAVLTAILAHEILEMVERPTFVLIDGDRQKADDFARALAGFSEVSPTVTNCYQSEIYYPHALLADLSAGYLASKIRTGEYDYVNPILRTSPADRTRSEAWGKAFDHLRTRPESNYQRLGAESAYAETGRERARVWFSGKMGDSSENALPSVSIATIIRQLESRGHVTVADSLREL